MNPPAPSSKRLLIAGIGNIFQGDDAFGSEVARALARRPLPGAVEVMDVGIRGYDLAYALAEGFELVILVDAVPRGQPPGTLYLIEPELAQAVPAESGLADAHSLDPVRVLQMAQELGSGPRKLILLGCEPARLESEEGQLGLSPAVEAALPLALQRIEELVEELLGGVGPEQAPASARLAGSALKE